MQLTQPSAPPSRSSVAGRLNALTDIGGVNSIRSFTRSWQRAAGFPEVIPQRPSFVFAPDQTPVGAPAGDVSPYGPHDFEPAPAARPSPPAHPSLLHQQLEAARGQSPPHGEGAEPAAASHGLYRHASAGSREHKAPDSGELAQAFRVGSYGSASGNSIFAVPPHLATPSIVGSYGSAVDYGTIGSDVSRESMGQAAALWRQQQEARENVPDGELPPILVKEVEQDGKFVLTVEGQSTLPQTVFNSTK